MQWTSIAPSLCRLHSITFSFLLLRRRPLGGLLQLSLPEGPSTTSQVLFLGSRVMFPAQGMQAELKFSPRASQELHQFASLWGFP